MPKKESKYVQVLRLYLSKRDDHGTGIENGLTVPDISQKFHWKKGGASSALQIAKKRGRKLDRPLMIECDRIGNKFIHYIPANENEAQSSIEKHHLSLLGQVKAQRERLDILSDQYPELIYSPVKAIEKRIQLLIPFPVEGEKK